MTDDWPSAVAAFLRRYGLPADHDDHGVITGLPRCTARAAEVIDDMTDGELVSSAGPGAMPLAVITPRHGSPSSPPGPVDTANVTMSLVSFARLLGGTFMNHGGMQSDLTHGEVLAMLRVAVAALTDHAEGYPVPLLHVVADVDPVAVIAALAGLNISLLRALLPDGGAEVLRRLGLIAAGGDVR